MSSMYRAAPVTLSRPSLRGTDFPMTFSSIMQNLPRQSSGATHRASHFTASCLSEKLPVAEYQLSSQIRRFYHTPKFVSQVWRYGMTMIQTFFGHHELTFWVDNYQVGFEPFRNLTFASVAARESSGFCRHPPSEVIQGESPFRRFGPHYWQGHGETRNAASRAFKISFFELLHCWRTRRVISGYKIDDSVLQTLPQLFPIL